MDRLLALKTFVLVAEQRSFAAAARRLGLSPTAASRGIAALERELGVVLLARTTRSVGLTPEGAGYLERCRAILDELDEADRAVRGEDSAPGGTLFVTAPVLFGRLHIRPVVGRLLEAYPALRVRLWLSDRSARVVEEGIDVAVRIAELADSSLHAVRLGAVRRVLVASPGYLARHGEPVTVAGLEQHRLIVVDSFAPAQEWRFNASGRPVLRCEASLLTNSVEASIDAALDGLGIARVLSYQVQAELADGRLQVLLADQEPPPVPVSLLFQGRRRRSPNVVAFLDACRDHFRARPLG